MMKNHGTWGIPIRATVPTFGLSGSGTLGLPELVQGQELPSCHDLPVTRIAEFNTRVG